MRRTSGIVTLAFALPLSIALAGAALVAAPTPSADAAVLKAERLSWYKARARLFWNGGKRGKADYKDRERDEGFEQRLQVKTQNMSPNTEHDVLFNGVFLGTITTDEFGTGKLKLRTAEFIDSPDWLPLPDNFPRIIDGDEIEVGPALGVFAERD